MDAPVMTHWLLVAVKRKTGMKCWMAKERPGCWESNSVRAGPLVLVRLRQGLPPWEPRTTHSHTRTHRGADQIPTAPCSIDAQPLVLGRDAVPPPA